MVPLCGGVLEQPRWSKAGPIQNEGSGLAQEIVRGNLPAAPVYSSYAASKSKASKQGNRTDRGGCIHHQILLERG